MNLKKVRDLDIAKNSFGFSSEIKVGLDYQKWSEFIDLKLDYFTWRENTAEGIETLKNIPSRWVLPSRWGLRFVPRP